MGKKLFAHSVVSEIVKELESRIVSGELAPGQRLVEGNLAEEWGMSRTSLREAFRVLESLEHIKHEPCRGVAVAQISPEHIREVYQVRAVLEGLVVKLSVANGGESLIATLKGLHHAMRQARRQNNMERYAQLNERFHQAILDPSGNDFLQSVMRSIHKNVARCMAYSRPGRHEDFDISHESLIKHFEAGDAENAAFARSERIIAMGEIVISQMRTGTAAEEEGE